MTVTTAPEPATTHDVGTTTPSVGSLAGAGQLLHLALRRDRVRAGLWFVGVVGMVAAVAESMKELYGTAEAVQRYADLVRDNATMIVQAGPGYGLDDDPTSGAVLMNELSIWVFIAVALMNLFVVVRHTRTEEATERTELVRAAPVGRSAGTAAALATSTLLTVAIAAGSAVALVAVGYGTAGAAAFGGSMVGIGLVFATTGAVAAQLTENPRTSLGLGGACLAAAFVARAVGDVTAAWLSWTSPLGWAQAIRAYADERWWVLAVPLAASALLVGVAVRLQAHRDHGGGIVPARSGPPTASDRLSSPLALAARLQRASIVAWAVGLGLLGFFYGVISDQVESILESYPEMEDYLVAAGDASVTDLFLSQSVVTMSLIATGFAVSSALRLRREEMEGRVDVLLATPTSRERWVAGHVALTVAGTVAVLAAVGASVAIGAALVTGEVDRVPGLTGAAISLSPAVLLVAGAALVVQGWFPRASLTAWGVFAIVLVIGLFGELLSLPAALRNLSPFEHLDVPPAEPVALGPLVVIGALCAVCFALGVAGIRRRDIR